MKKYYEGNMKWNSEKSEPFQRREGRALRGQVSKGNAGLLSKNWNYTNKKDRDKVWWIEEDKKWGRELNCVQVLAIETCFMSINEIVCKFQSPSIGRELRILLCHEASGNMMEKWRNMKEKWRYMKEKWRNMKDFHIFLHFFHIFLHNSFIFVHIF